MQYDYTEETIEKILLKKVLSDKKYISIMSNFFDKRWFENNKNIGIIMDLAIKYFKKYAKIPDNRSVAELIKMSCAKYKDQNINDINNTLLEVNSFDIKIDDECANTNIKNYVLQKGCYYTVSDTVQDMVSTGNVDKCLSRLEAFQKISFQDDDLGMFYFNKDDMDKHWNYIKNPEAKLSTGWPALDRVTNGGFLRDGRMLAIFAAQAGLGKSLFLSNLATNLLHQDKSVVVISLEMSQDVYSTRFDAVISNKNINCLNRSADSARNRIESFYQRHPQANLIIKEYPPKSVRVLDIESYLDKLVDNGVKIDAIVVDYLNLVLPNTRIEGMYESIKAVSEQLRALSYKYNAPVFTATQTNREGTNNDNVDIQNISESSGQAMTADFVGILFSKPQDRSQGIIKMRVGKNRFGAPGNVLDFHIDRDTLALYDDTDCQADNGEPTESENIFSNLSNLSVDVNSDENDL